MNTCTELERAVQTKQNKTLVKKTAKCALIPSQYHLYPNWKVIGNFKGARGRSTRVQINSTNFLWICAVCIFLGITNICKWCTSLNVNDWILNSPQNFISFSTWEPFPQNFPKEFHLSNAQVKDGIQKPNCKIGYFHKTAMQWAYWNMTFFAKWENTMTQDFQSPQSLCALCSIITNTSRYFSKSTSESSLIIILFIHTSCT